jgi:hypothetical protein
MKSLEKQILKIKQQIIQIGDLRPGKITPQYNVCGKAGCKCKENPPQKHGPYYQLNYTRKGKKYTFFVKKEDLEITQGQLKNFEKLKQLVDQWIELSNQVCLMKLKKNSY